MIQHWLNFRTEIIDDEDGDKIIYSVCDDGIWHEIAKELPAGKYVIVIDNQIRCVEPDPTRICPLENEIVFNIDGLDLKLMDYVYFNGETLIKIEAPEYPIFDKYDEKKWTTSLSLEEQLDFYRNRMSVIYKKIKEQKEEIEFLGFGEVDQKLYDELEKLKQKHMEVAQELAILENEKYK